MEEGLGGDVGGCVCCVFVKVGLMRVGVEEVSWVCGGYSGVCVVCG